MAYARVRGEAQNENFTTKDTKCTKVKNYYVRTLRDLRGKKSYSYMAILTFIAVAAIAFFGSSSQAAEKTFGDGSLVEEIRRSGFIEQLYKN